MKTRAEQFLGLMDCNNFFVSCERVFDPTLIGQPVLVLSSNDGCVVARSEEAKKLGIIMGIPVFKIKNIIEQKNIKLRSTNFNLYRDMSLRVMNVLKELAGETEIYSIDEAFFDLEQVPNPIQFSENIRKKIYQYTGIPVSIGMAKTKTLAKLANRLAKAGEGVFQINDKNFIEILGKTKLLDVWGIGKQNTKSLLMKRIINARELIHCEDSCILNNFNKKILETKKELKGQTVYPFQTKKDIRKSIICSKSFRAPVCCESDLRIALTEHLENAVKQLRCENLVAKKISIYISTGLFARKKYHGEEKIVLNKPTNDTLFLIKKIMPAIKKIYKPEFNYKKTGICLSEISSEGESDGWDQGGLFMTENENCDNEEICLAIDRINKKYDRQLVKTASSKLDSISPNNIKNNMNFTSPTYRSSEYTTNWSDILIIK